jgi:hypothetical protein
MFIGHYGVAFAVKRAEKQIPLWHLFIAVQFVDVVWAILILLGVEKARITDAYRGSLPLDLQYMPYTHSLAAAILWSLLAYAVYRLVGSHRASLLIAVAVLSHWILDLVVHRPDLPLYDNTHKMGFALWNYPLPALGLETALYFGALWWYLRSSEAVTFAKRYGMAMLGLIILAVQVTVFWSGLLPSAKIAAAIFLIGYAQLAAAVGWLEKKEESSSRQVQPLGERREPRI